jgi:hypothetical protein
MVYGINEVDIWPYENQADLWVIVVLNWNFLTTFNGIL